MDLVIYEHPLNEKIRTFMRVEHLFEQINGYQPIGSDVRANGFFAALFALIDLLERSDVRAQLTKELERSEQNLVKWAQHPQICNDVLQDTLKSVVRLQNALSKKNRICSPLKQDRFLASLKQRFSIPGGSCHFDLPQLHYWTKLPEPQQTAQIAQWLNHLASTKEAIRLVLTFVRERGHFTSMKAPLGFHQDNTGHIEMLRIKYTPAYGAFPTISGNKHRYAIRFMQLNDEADTGRSNAEQDIMFSLAKC